MHVLVIGGSDAGIAAALRMQELDPKVEVSVLLADAFPNYSVCGLPFFVSGETPDWHDLAHRTDFGNIAILANRRAEAIDPHRKEVLVRGTNSRAARLLYDKLIVATGAVPRRPSFVRADAPHVHSLHTMPDAFNVRQAIEQAGVSSAVVVGAGYIGVEMADALSHRGLAVTLVGRSSSVLPTVDIPFGNLVEAELREHGVTVVTGRSMVGLETEHDRPLVIDTAGQRLTADVVILATGVEPATALARSSGIRLGHAGAIAVTRRMETGVPDVFAAGDCVETWHRLLRHAMYLPLGTTAHKQGRVAGEDALGGDREFAGSLGTQVVKVFSLAVGRTGLLQHEAEKGGFDPLTTETEAWDHKAYYPGARRLRLRVTADRHTHRLLGAQILGDWRSEVSKRLDVFAAALHHDMTVEAMNDLDLSYTPPFSSPWDPVQVAAQEWLRQARR